MSGDTPGMSDLVIRAEGLRKVFRIYDRRIDWLAERLIRRPLHHVNTAVDDVGFSLRRGRVLGVIGQNGAGKSTLLKLVMGVALPDRGTLEVRGRTTGLLELGTGFNADLTGRANIAFNATLLGMSGEEIAARREAIIAFSELGEAIDEPLRTYSSGMVMRLAFSIAIHAEPACFVVDEALSVGDIHFQQKCMARIRAFRDGGGAILFVSHDLNAVKVLCDEVIVLDHGRVVAQGSPEEAVNVYNRIIARLEAEQEAAEGESERRLIGDYGSREAEITGGRVLGAAGGENMVAAGEEGWIDIDVQAHRAIRGATLGIALRDRFGQEIFGTNTLFMGEPIDLEAGARMRFRFALAFDLGPGAYTLTAALHEDEHHLGVCYHWRDRLIAFEVAGFTGTRFAGLAGLKPRLTRVELPPTAGQAHAAAQ